MSDDLRKRLLAAGRHLTPTRFGWAVNQALEVRGIDWGGCSKGEIIEAARAWLTGERGIYGHRAGKTTTVEELEEALREFPAKGARPAPWRTGR